MRLHLGCGNTILDGWTNLDWREGPGVDVVADLADCKNTPLPFDDDSVSEMVAAHVLEHVTDHLPLMAELHRIARPDCKAVFKTPYGSCDDAWEDPTHVRPMFVGSWTPFSQPYYWRTTDSYGYTGDWHLEKLTIELQDWVQKLDREEWWHTIHTMRNGCGEMVATMRAVKPVRAREKSLLAEPNVTLLYQ